jgi:hypothetical protein
MAELGQKLAEAETQPTAKQSRPKRSRAERAARDDPGRAQARLEVPGMLADKVRARDEVISQDPFPDIDDGQRDRHLAVLEAFAEMCAGPLCIRPILLPRKKANNSWCHPGGLSSWSLQCVEAQKTVAGRIGASRHVHRPTSTLLTPQSGRKLPGGRNGSYRIGIASSFHQPDLFRLSQTALRAPVATDGCACELPENFRPV